VESLKRARPTTLARIPYVTLPRASALVQAAKESVAALRDPYHGEVIQRLAGEILRQQKEIAAGKQRLIRSLERDPEVQLCASLPGIGLWTAVVLRLECGSLARFHSEAALTAFAGLNPRRHESGDTDRPAKISRRGRKEIRAALYMAALTAIRWNPVIRAFYDRLTQQGKLHLVALTACMAKMLRIAYACVLSGQPFDPEQHRRLQERREQQAANQPEAPQSEAPSGTTATGSLTAPVSRREAQRRRAATMPQAGVPRRERGPGAALEPHDTAGRNEARTSPIQLSKTR